MTQQQTPQEPIRLPSPPSQRAHWQRPPQGIPPQATPPPVPPAGGQWIWHPNPGQPLQPPQLQPQPIFQRSWRHQLKPVAIAMLAVALILVLYGGGPFFVLASLLMIEALILVCLL